MDIIVLHETPPHPDPLPQGTRELSLPPPLSPSERGTGGGIKEGCGTLFEEFQISKRFYGSLPAHLFQRSKTQANRGSFRFVIDKAAIIRAELHTSNTSRLAVRHTRNWR